MHNNNNKIILIHLYVLNNYQFTIYIGIYLWFSFQRVTLNTFYRSNKERVKVKQNTLSYDNKKKHFFEIPFCIENFSKCFLECVWSGMYGSFLLTGK